MSATAGPATVESIDPANGELVETYEVFTEGQIDAALDLSHGAFRTYRRAPWSERSELMSGVARQKYPPAPPFVRDQRVEAIGRDTPDIDRVGINKWRQSPAHTAT